MDIFKQQEMSKSRLQVKDKLKDLYDWLVHHIPKPIKEKASRELKTSKDKIMGLYKWVKGEKEPEEEQTKDEEPEEEQNKESSNPVELEQAFVLLVVLLAGPISHTSTRCMDFVEIFNIILDLSITCFSHFSGC